MKKLLQSRFYLVLLVLASGAMFQQGLLAQGVTTSSLTGSVSDASGEPLIGANIVAVHLPSGTTYGTVTDLDGSFTIPNMRVGGPYKITTTYTGFGDNVTEGIMLRLGEAQKMDIVLEDQPIELMGILVTATRGATGQNAGASTQITSADLDALPTLNRDLNDFTRLTPQASTSVSGISFAGVNNRYNAIYIDGAVNNDVFGLAASGTNGGQTGISPISVDVIDQIQVVLSPYDVTLGGFAGGGINAVTKSGTNTFSGTAYFFNKNQDLAGKTPGKLIDRIGGERTKLAQFSEKLYGASLGGPIKKDKVFFFANVEIQKDETPSPFDFATYRGDSDAGTLNQLSSFLKNNYSYDPGDYGSKLDQLDGLKLFGKLDFNLSDKHKLTIRHQYTKAIQTDQTGSSSTTLNFANDGIYFPSTTNSFAAELNSRFSNKMSNNLIIGYTSVLDDRDPIGGDFPFVRIQDGAGAIQFGSEEYSTANELDQKIFTLTDNLKLYRGDHTFTLGTHNEFYHIYNTFIPQNYGSYDYASVQDFLDNATPTDYDRSYSLVDGITGDGTAAAADFNAMQLGIYGQDEWSVTNKFTLTAGLRIDVPFITSDPKIDPSFNSSTLPALQAKYDIADDIVGGKAPDGQIMFSPRVGFSYDVNRDNMTVLRGGLGIFTSRIPFVWPGAMFNNNGLTLGYVGSAPDGFKAGINAQYTNPNFTIPSGQVDLFTKNFKYPQVFRTNLAFDKALASGWKFSVEGIFTKTLNNVLYTNVNSDPTVSLNWAGKDNRPVYTRKSIDPAYSAIYVGSNTHEGYTYNFSGMISKQWQSGLNFMLAYTYGDATAINEGTSSQNSSQWRGQVSIDGRNLPVLGRSDYSLGSRLISAISYKVDWVESGAFATTVSLFYEGQSGIPFSYVIGARNGQNPNNETGSTSRNRSLPYIPSAQGDIVLVEKNGLTPAQQWELLNAFISDDPSLDASRGGYADKNGSRAPFTSQWDLAIRQDLGSVFGADLHRIQLSLDIENFANLINKNWGTIYNVVGDFNNSELFQYEGLDGNTPTFSFTNDRTGLEKYDISSFASRWRMRVGVRYIFN